MKATLIRVALLALVSIVSLTVYSQSPGRPNGLEFSNGRWFNGAAFETATFYGVDGLLTKKRPGKVDSIVDLTGKYIVPPFGEAHNHNISRPATERELNRYAQQGIFYVMIQNNMPPDPAIQTASPPPTPVEVSYANGGLTAPGGHVVELHENIISRGGLKGLSKADLDGRAFFVVDNEADLDSKWPRILAAKPDFVKVYLGFSEELEKRKDAPAYFGKRGLHPRILKSVVRRAHQSGLRVSAHIETAADFHEAVAADVDIIAHLPGWRVGSAAGFPDKSIDRWMISQDDARLAAKKGVVVVTTTLAGKGAANPSDENHAAFREIHKRNLSTLARNKVTLAIGSDYYEGTSLAEVLLLGTQPLLGGGVEPLQAFDNLTLLKMWCEATPSAIFPRRRIGHLEEGYESSFLALEGNPIEDFAFVRRIALQVKQGQVLPMPAAQTSR